MFTKKAAVQPPEAENKKVKKPLYKKWWFWLLILVVIGNISSSGNSKRENDLAVIAPPISSPSPTSSPTPTPAPTPEIPLANASEELVWTVLHNNECKLISIETVDYEDGSLSVIAAIKCTNDEEALTELANEIAAQIINTPETESVMLSMADIKDKDDTCLAIVGILDDGTISITSMSLDYNSAHNKWVREQFSAWDGSNTVLTKLIKQSLNDEKSYEHIKTTYRNIRTEEDRNDVNKVLSDAGYSQRVEIGDLFIQTQFSAKNGFNAIIKSTAYGISSYSSNTVTLIDIG